MTSEDSNRKVVDYYKNFDEQGRLSVSLGQVEYLRTQVIIRRFLKPPPALVLDVGGAAGRYACWLARHGYQVHLIDPVPTHIQQARSASEAQPKTPIASCQVGDARKLDFEDEVVDAVLLLGPMYHLVESRDRLHALKEAHRVLKTGGVLFAAAISQFASTIDGLSSGFFLDPAFRKIMERDLVDGQHRNPTQNPAYFMDTYFHHPEALKDEVIKAGFEIAGLLAVEGISYLMVDFDQNWADEHHRDFLLSIIEKTEREPSLIGASPHLICVGVKQ